jgi:AhpC/TSA antioxidant enzyme
LRQSRAELAAKGAVMIVVSFDPVRRVRGFCRRFAQPFTCVSDEPRAAYRAFGLGRASWLRTLTPRALAPYVRLYLSTRRASFGRVAENDLRQMGGDFVVSPDGILTLAYASHDPADRPPVEQILGSIG